MKFKYIGIFSMRFLLYSILLLVGACSEKHTENDANSQNRFISTTSVAASSVISVLNVSAASSVIAVSDLIAASSVAKASGVASVHNQSDENDDNANKEKAIKINTKYGLVEYYVRSAEITVNGESVYESSDDSLDYLESKGDFKLSNEEVILFELGATNSAGIEGETFFLILSPNKAPEIVQTPIEFLTNPVKRAWQEKDVVFVDFEVRDYGEIKSPFKLESDKVNVTKVTPAIYAKSGPRLTDEDCSNLYDISNDDCSSLYAEHHLECDKYANADGNIGTSRAAMGTFRWLSQQPGFNKTKFNQSCIDWCKSKEVPFAQFSKNVCNIKK